MRITRVRMTRSWLLGMTPLSLVFAAGCSGGVSVYPVEGKVTYNGKPMQGGGTIAFIPVAGKQEGKTAGGEIDEKGNYKLTTYSPGDGSMVGEFKVVIMQVTEKEPEATEDGKAVASAGSSVAPALRIPMVYADQHNTPLKAKVEAVGKNELNFDLKPMAEAMPHQGASLKLPRGERVVWLQVPPH